MLSPHFLSYHADGHNKVWCNPPFLLNVPISAKRNVITIIVIIIIVIIPI